MKRKTIIITAVGVLAIGVLALGIFRRDLGTWHVAREFSKATTPDAQLRACLLIHRLHHNWRLLHGMRIEAEDAAGNSIRPWETGEYNNVAFVTVIWENGIKVRRPLLHEHSLTYIMGE